MLPDDQTYHEDKRLMADLANLNTHIGRYVLTYLSADAGTTVSTSLSEEHELGIALINAGVCVIDRADRRRHGSNEQRSTTVESDGAIITDSDVSTGVD